MSHLRINLTTYGLVRKHSRIASQDDHLGDNSGWYKTFLNWLNGFHARIFGFVQHYEQLHDWFPFPRMGNEDEYHLSTAFFQMDSGIECLTYTLNALGSAITPALFHDITSKKGLARITPLDIIGELPGSKSGRVLLPGYQEIFPPQE